MNERLKEAFEAWRKGTTVAESIERSKIYPYLALPVLEAAAKGEFPGFQLMPVEPAREMLNAAIDAHGYKLCEISALGLRCSPQQMFEKSYAAMLTAYKEEQK